MGALLPHGQPVACATCLQTTHQETTGRTGSGLLTCTELAGTFTTLESSTAMSAINQQITKLISAVDQIPTGFKSRHQWQSECGIGESQMRLKLAQLVAAGHAEIMTFKVQTPTRICHVPHYRIPAMEKLPFPSGALAGFRPHFDPGAPALPASNVKLGGFSRPVATRPARRKP